MKVLEFPGWRWFLLPPVVAFAVVVYLMHGPSEMERRFAEQDRARAEARLARIEKRLGEVDVRTDGIAFTLRLERQSREDEQQRRIEASVARANAARDALRDR